MAEQYQRTQLLLKPEQHQELGQLAQRSGRSISDVTREVLTLGLEVLRQMQQRPGDALRRLAQRRMKLAEGARAGPGNPVAEARADWDEQRDQALGLTKLSASGIER